MSDVPLRGDLTMHPRNRVLFGSVLALVVGACGASAPPATGASNEPVATDSARSESSGTSSVEPVASQPAAPADRTEFDLAGRPIDPNAPRAWERPGGDHHGRCCVSDAECGGLRCLEWQYNVSVCRSVCTLECAQGELCPQRAGTTRGPEPCPASGRCPISPPGA